MASAHFECVLGILLRMLLAAFPPASRKAASSIRSKIPSAHFECVLGILLRMLLAAFLLAGGNAQGLIQTHKFASQDTRTDRLDIDAALLKFNLQPDSEQLPNLLSRRRNEGGDQGPDAGEDQILEASKAMKLEIPGDGVDATLPGMLASLSRSGIVYAKNVLVEKVLRELTPMQLPDLDFTEKVVGGSISCHLFNITLSSALVKFSNVSLSPTDGATIIAEGVSAKISLGWHYVYHGGLLHDHGVADVKVSDASAGVRFFLDTQNGSLSLRLEEDKTVLNHLEISIHGSLPYVYNWLAQAFRNHVRAAVQAALMGASADAVAELNEYLQSLPRVMPVDDTSAINVSLVAQPLISAQSLTVGSRMEFVPVLDSGQSDGASHPGRIGTEDFPCGARNEMVIIRLNSFVFNSAAMVYYQAGCMHYLVDNLPNRKGPFRLDTGGALRFLLPTLYRKYPDRPMTLDFNASRAPTVSINPLGTGDNFEGVIRAAADFDLFVGVVLKDTKKIVQVMCLQAAVEVAGSVGLRKNNITMKVHLDKLKLSTKWTTVGRIPKDVLMVVQGLVEAAVNLKVVPTLNHYLQLGFAIPVFEGVELQNSEVAYVRDCLVLCTNISYVGPYGLEGQGESRYVVEIDKELGFL